MNAKKKLIEDPMLDELLDKAAQMSRQQVEEGIFSSAFGIGRRIKSTLLCEYVIKYSPRGYSRESEFRHVVEALRKYQSLEYTQWQSSTPPHLRPHALRASAICQRRPFQPASGEIVILLESMAGYSMCWVSPYRMTESGYKFGELVAQLGEPMSKPIVFSSDYSSTTQLNTHRVFQFLNRVIPDTTNEVIPDTANEVIPDTTNEVIPDTANEVIPDTDSTILYDQNNQQITFFLNENICSEISSWNRQHLTSQTARFVLPTFQLTLLKDESDAMCIEIEQLHPRSLEGEKFKQIFPAQRLDSSISRTSSPIQSSYLNPPDYKLPTVVFLTLSLVKYFHLIDGWQDWTAETALSGRYIYAFGEIYGDPYEDGWIEDTATGELLTLIDPIPIALSE